MSDDDNINISIMHDDSVDISQVLLLPKAPIMKPVMFRLIRQNTSGARLNNREGDHVSKDIGVGAEGEISAPIASDLAAPAATAPSGMEGVGLDGEMPADLTELATPVPSAVTVAVNPAAPPSDTEEETPPPVAQQPLVASALTVAVEPTAPPSGTEEDTPSPIIQRLRIHPKPKAKTFVEIFGWDNPDDNFYVGSQPQEYPPTSIVRSMFKDKGKRKAEPDVYIKSEEDDTKRIRFFD